MAEDYEPPYAAQIPNKLVLKEYHPQRMGHDPYFCFTMVSARAAMEEDGTTPKTDTLGMPYYDDLSQYGEEIIVSVYTTDQAGLARLQQMQVAALTDLVTKVLAAGSLQGDVSAIVQAMLAQGQTVEETVNTEVYALWADVKAGNLPESAFTLRRKAGVVVRP